MKMTASISNSLHHIPKNQSLEDLFCTGFTFPINKILTSPATRIMFNNNDFIGQQICLKVWWRCDNGLYDTRKLEACNRYTLEGLVFNRRFARDIYPGIVLVHSMTDCEIICGPLIPEPAYNEFASDQPYALVMKRL